MLRTAIALASFLLLAPSGIAAMEGSSSSRSTSSSGYSTDEDCPICKEELGSYGGKGGVICSRNHRFCNTCIKNWLGQQLWEERYASCPVCRQIIISEEYVLARDQTQNAQVQTFYDLDIEPALPVLQHYGSFIESLIEIMQENT